jgi:hypothetical protein
MCDGDWNHEGRCLDGLPVGCPWCFPKEVSPAPGARTGPHFHYCPACATSWRHTSSCSEPFDAAQPDCSGGVGQNERGHAHAPDHLGRRLHLVRTVLVTGNLAASLALALSFTPTEWPGFWTAVPMSVEPPASPVSPPPPVSTGQEQARTEEPSAVTAPSREPTKLARREGMSARRTKEVSLPSLSPEVSLPSGVTAPPPTTESISMTGSPPAATLEPSPSTPASEATVESPPETTKRVATAPIEDAARRTTEVQVIERSIPGAPPFGTAGGGRGWETFLEGRDPRPIDRPTRLGNRPRD